MNSIELQNASGLQPTIRDVLMEMRHGGTTADVQTAMVDRDERLDRGTIQSALFFLVDIGLAELDENGGRWWKAIKPCQSQESS